MQQILRIDLSTKNISKFIPEKRIQEKYLGGASLAARLLYDTLSAEIDALSEQAPLLFLTGPLTGTTGPAVGRFVVCGRSPATGIWGESNCGGHWGVELRKAGYDGLWIEGKAEEPVTIYIHNQDVQIRSGKHLWGLDTYSTQSTLRKEIGNRNVKVATIGQAGEKMIPFSIILCDDHSRAAGRTGMGAVMGSKNLKAIAVLGEGSIPLFNDQAYKELRSKANKDLRLDALSVVLRQLGTSSSAEYFDLIGMMPKKYFHRRYLGEELKISGAAFQDSLLKGVSACHGCVIACGRVVQLKDGIKRKGPEYETNVGFGPNLLINDPVATTKLNDLCDKYGLDVISMSNIIGLAFHLNENGMIAEKEFSIPQKTWGNSAYVEELVLQTVRQEKLGFFMAQGSLKFAQAFSASDEAIQVKGLEVPYHDPRAATGMALVYATSPIGASHNQSDYFMVEIGQVDPELGLETFERLGGAEKASNVARHQNWLALKNSLVMCIFANVPVSMLTSLVNAATGFEYSLEDLHAIGERAWSLKRLINKKFGITKADDKLPKPLLQPLPDGDDTVIPEIEEMLTAYYQARGWDISNGMPTEETIERLKIF